MALGRDLELHLKEIFCQVAAGAQAILMLDQAGWHMSGKLEIPSNIIRQPIPAKCPELNPVETVCQFMRENWLSNDIFLSHEESSNSRGTSFPLASDNGHMGSNQCTLV